MFETIKRLYARTGNKAIVRAAAEKKWITPEQCAEIVGEGKA